MHISIPNPLCDVPTSQLEDILAKLRLHQVSIEKELESRRQQESSDFAECGLTLKEISKFSRHLLLPEFGVPGQLKLCRADGGVLVVGAGGLGCPALLYLASSGVAKLGIVDHDTVDISNLHRQVLHTESRLGMSKAESAKIAIQALNNDVKADVFDTALDSTNALDIIGAYDVVMDCSDNVATRYLLNDACVIKGIPLVSGSALRFEGQLTVYNYQGGPTYRCLFPEPPPAEMVTNCSDGGVLGPIPGVIGVLQAVEALKILSGSGDVLSQKLLLFDGRNSTFRTVNLRSRTKFAEVESLIDYEQFCGAKATDKDKGIRVLDKVDRISATTFAETRNPEKQLLIDVRSEPEMSICSLQNSTNIPFQDLDKSLQVIEDQLNDNRREIIVVCRRGNDSQLAVKFLKEKLKDRDVVIRDIVGGLHSWAKNVDPSFPVY